MTMGRNNPAPAKNGRDSCYFCGSDGPIESHHIIPRRFDGTDHDSNIVDLCPTCHERLERLYDDEYYAKIGASERSEQVQLIIGAVSTELKQLAEDIHWRANSLEDRFMDTDIHDAREQAVESLKENDPDFEVADADAAEPMETVYEIIDDSQSTIEDGEFGIAVTDIIKRAAEYGMEPEYVEHVLQKLKRRGEVYEPSESRFAAT